MPQEPLDQRVISATTVDLTTLEEWHKEYLAFNANGDRPSAMAAVDSDQLDPTFIEDLVLKAIKTTNVSGGFCNRCLYLFSHWPDLGTKAWSHGVGRSCHTAEIEAATRLGCRFCSFLLQRLRQEKALDTFRKIERRLAHLNDNSTASISISNWTNDESQLLWLNFPGKTTTECNADCAQVTKFQSHVVPPSSYIENYGEVLDLASGWLQTCSDSHQCFDEGISERPARLLCVAEDAVKLVSTVNYTTLPRYATLSYCWGTSEFLKLTEDNIGVFFHGIAFENLPSTFKDAISIARALGIQYIWIDALCIIQASDDHRDWRTESGLMRAIYGGSYLNIAATSATSVHCGLFSRPAEYCGGVLARVETQTSGRVRNFHSSSVYEESTTDNHLASRAWALQEKLLAPRTIYFGDQGLFWECRTEIASEFLPSGFPGKLGSQMVLPQHKAWNWMDIVFHYSKASLTKSSDKLPALSGVARRQYEVDGDIYLAGMWRKRFVKQLGWTSVQGSSRPPWRAPSWSWASVDEQAHYWPYWNHDELAKEEYVDVVHASTSAAGPDPFGAIDDAELRLACTYLVRGRYSPTAGAQTATVLSLQEEHQFPFELDSADDGALEHDDLIFFLPLFGGESGHRYQLAAEQEVNTDTDDSDEGGLDEDYDTSSLATWEIVLMIRGMILRQHESKRGVFRRIGALDLTSGHFSKHPKEYYAFMKVIKEVGQSTAEAECIDIRSNDSSSKAKYLIDIV